MNEFEGNCCEINYTLIIHVNMLLLLHESTEINAYEIINQPT